jgi:hypothetical protein
MPDFLRIMNWKRTAKVLTIIVGVASVAAAIYIMARGLGLQKNLDFGAGAYYYADIPEFDKYTESTSYKPGLPYWVYVVLFLAWGALMYWLWKFIDRK